MKTIWDNCFLLNLFHFWVTGTFLLMENSIRWHLKKCKSVLTAHCVNSQLGLVDFTKANSISVVILFMWHLFRDFYKMCTKKIKIKQRTWRQSNILLTILLLLIYMLGDLPNGVFWDYSNRNQTKDTNVLNDKWTMFSSFQMIKKSI